MVTTVAGTEATALNAQLICVVIPECHPVRVMTIVIAFHGSGFRTFKEFYTLSLFCQTPKTLAIYQSCNSYTQSDLRVIY